MKGVKVVAISLLAVLFITHKLLLPLLISYYEEDCYMSKTKYDAYRLFFQRIVTLYDQLEQVYWVDSGLLLGYYRLKDMLPYDGDIDINRIHVPSEEAKFDKRFQAGMRAFPETYGNAMIAKMNFTDSSGRRTELTADLFRYQIEVINGQKVVVNYWNQHITNTSK